MFPRRILTCYLPDALKATSASFTARHDRLLRSITQCPAYQPTKPIICIPLYPSTCMARIIPLTRRPSHAFATAIGMLRGLSSSLCPTETLLYDASVLVLQISIISDTFYYHCTGSHRCRIAGEWPAILLSKAVSELPVGTTNATWPAFPHSRL